VFIKGSLLGVIVIKMPSEGKGRLFKRKDNKYLIYLPKDLCEDTMFPFKDFSSGRRGDSDSIAVKVSFKIGGGQKLIVEKWPGPAE